MIKEEEKIQLVDNLHRCGIIKDKQNTLTKFKNGRLSFRVPKTNNLPSNVNDVLVSLVFDIECGQDAFNEDEKKEIDKNTNKKLKYEIPSYSKFVFSIQFSGKDDNGIEYLSAWHLDYEPRTKYVFLNNPKVYHPLFHLHYGGSSIREIYRELNMYQELLDEKSFTKSLVEDIKDLFDEQETKDKIDAVFLSHSVKSSEFIKCAVNHSNTSFVPLYMIAPRIPFPPVDEYLGLDFVISNFFEKSSYICFRKNAFFKQKIAESQNKLWKDYFDIIMGFWNNKNSFIKPNMLIPSLV